MGKFLKGLAWTVVGMALVVGILRLTVLEWWRVPDDPVLGMSTQPTFADGDLILLWTVGEANVGALVRCPDPDEPTRFVVGRVMGQGGDEVVVDENGLVTVNGTELRPAEGCTEHNFIAPHPKTGAEVDVSCAKYDHAGRIYLVGSAAKLTSKPSTTTVPPGDLFLVSDNRMMHDDSRDFGTVPASSCGGTVFFRLWGLEGFSDAKTRFTFLQ